MNEQDLANVVNVFAIIVGMTTALVVGYLIGYQDGKRSK
jgi:hypothetical protein